MKERDRKDRNIIEITHFSGLEDERKEGTGVFLGGSHKKDLFPTQARFGEEIVCKQVYTHNAVTSTLFSRQSSHPRSLNSYTFFVFLSVTCIYWLLLLA